MEVEDLPNTNHDEDSDDNMQMFDDEEEDELPGNPADEAEEVPAPGADGEPKVIKPKRVIKNPQPKLDSIRLMGPRGVGIIQSTFKDIKFKGKGHEREDLKLLMKRLEHWAHRLFPKMPFDDTLNQIEKLGTKKPVQNMMKRIRLDMFQSDEMNDVDNRGEGEDEPSNNEKEEVVDVFDELLSTGPFAEKRPESMSSQNMTMMLPISQSVQPTILTPEQQERMEKNRLLAMEKRKARLLQQQKEKEVNANAENSQDTSAVFNETLVPSSEIQPVNKDNSINSEAMSLRNIDMVGSEMIKTNPVFGDQDQSDTSSSEHRFSSQIKERPLIEDQSSVAADNSTRPLDTEEIEERTLVEDESSVVADSSTKPLDPEKIERPLIEDQSSVAANSYTKPSDTEDIDPRKVNTDHQMSNDIDMVTEDDVLGLISTEDSKS